MYPSCEELRNMTTEDLVKEYDSIAAGTQKYYIKDPVAALNYYLAEIARRDQNR